MSSNSGSRAAACFSVMNCAIACADPRSASLMSSSGEGITAVIKFCHTYGPDGERSRQGNSGCDSRALENAILKPAQRQRARCTNSLSTNDINWIVDLKAASDAVASGVSAQQG